MQVEKNDVNISKLFNWGTIFEFGLPNDDFKSLVYMRLIGDEDMNKARVYSLRKSREKRLSLNDESTDESIALIPAKNTFSKEQLLDMIVMFSARELSKRAVREIKLKLPKSPDEDSSLLEQEEYQHAIDTYNGKLEIERLEYVKKGMNKLKASLKEIPESKLYTEYKRRLIDEFCEQESLSALRVATTFYGTFRDEDYKIRYFDSIDELNNLPTFAKNQFISAYQSLDIGGEELKKLRGATQ